MIVVKINVKGCADVLDGTPGMTFIVERFTSGAAGKVAHVRDYRYRDLDNYPYQIWCIGGDGYEVVQP